MDSLRLNFYQNTHYEMRLSTETDSQWRKHIALAAVDSLVDTTSVFIRYNPHMNLLLPTRTMKL